MPLMVLLFMFVCLSETEGRSAPLPVCQLVALNRPTSSAPFDVHHTTYPQLISTRYASGQPLPVEGRQPVVQYDFVDRSRLPQGAKIYSAARGGHGTIWVVTDKGAFRSQIGVYIPLELPRILKPLQPKVHEDSVVNAVATNSDGHIWIATTHGLCVTDGEQWWQPIDRRDGMPFETMTCLHLAANGDVWGGTLQGAWRLRAGEFRYFLGRRWLMGNFVSAIWTDAKGRAWILTDGGTSCIEERPMTLAVKAATFDKITQEHNNRRGYIDDLDLNKPGELEGGIFSASDNDGLWNSIYVGAMCYRYAVTHDAAAKRQAKQAVEAMMDLERLTGVSGFPARAVVTDEELRAGIHGFDPNETVRVPGETDKIWFRSPVQLNIWCKGDTSSDELDGHYYAYYLYYDLVADAGEKAQLAALVRRITDNILDHDDTLVGNTGRKTLWGVWTPRYLNDDPHWADGRPLNSLELLCYLKVAEHLTGDAKYRQAYEELIRKHHYLLNVLQYRRGDYGRWDRINHSDDELAYLAYFPLMQLETDPARHALLTQSLARTWEDSPHEQTIKAEHSPLYNFMYGVLTGRACDTEAGIKTLQDWPWDRVNWTVRNSGRHDITFKQGEGVNDPVELTRVLPRSEQPLDRWNTNFWSPDGGADGRVLDDGAAFLLPCWLGVYAGYIGKEQ